MSVKPLAEVEQSVTIAGGLGCVRIGGPKGPSWGVNGGLWDRVSDAGVPFEPPAAAVAESLAHDINTAHAAVVGPLLAKLSQAREALRLLVERSFREVHPGRVAFEVWYSQEDLDAGRAAIAAIDADPPPEFVTKQKYDELQRVLSDLQEERRDVWRERCEKALAMLASGDPDDRESAMRAMALLEGRDVEPAKAEHPPTQRWTPLTVGPNAVALTREELQPGYIRPPDDTEPRGRR